jgi:hypothetical protein
MVALYSRTIRPRKPAALMVFQHGEAYLQRDGEWRVPVVLDNLIAERYLPVMAAVFVEHGQSLGKGSDGKSLVSNRSVEYDTLKCMLLIGYDMLGHLPPAGSLPRDVPLQHGNMSLTFIRKGSKDG